MIRRSQTWVRGSALHVRAAHTKSTGWECMWCAERQVCEQEKEECVGQVNVLGGYCRRHS